MTVQDRVAAFSVFMWIATSAELAELMGCIVEKFPIVCLGPPLGAKVMDGKIWQGVLDRCDKNLAPRKNSTYPLLEASR